MAKITSDDQKHQESATEDVENDPEADDDTQKAAQDVGIYEDQDEEHPGEVGLDKEVDKDEKTRWEK